MNIAPLNTWFNSNGKTALITGPCGAESYEQLTNTISELGKNNIEPGFFRAGVWKPRTRPNSFEGKGEEALKWLQELKNEFQIKTIVEVANAEHAELALKYGVDALWIGARTTGNPFSVQEIADVLKNISIPVLIKNPIHADLQLWLGAIERMANSGITQLAAIHRGFYVYGKTKYRNKPFWQIPIELRTLVPHLPIFCDPSHIGGSVDLISPISQKALDLGFDGLMIETHFNPAQALSDAQQQVTPFQLREILDGLICRQKTDLSDNDKSKLHELRNIIDDIDEDLLNLLKKRILVIEEIANYKKANHIAIFQLERWQEIIRTRAKLADKLGLNRQHVEKICQLLHEESIKHQNSIMNKSH